MTSLYQHSSETTLIELGPSWGNGVLNPHRLLFQVRPARPEVIQQTLSACQHDQSRDIQRTRFESERVSDLCNCQRLGAVIFNGDRRGNRRTARQHQFNRRL